MSAKIMTRYSNIDQDEWDKIFKKGKYAVKTEDLNKYVKKTEDIVGPLGWRYDKKTNIVRAIPELQS